MPLSPEGIQQLGRVYGDQFLIASADGWLRYAGREYRPFGRYPLN